MKNSNTFDYDRALRRISFFIIFLEIVGAAVSLLFSFKKFLNFFAGSFVAILGYVIIRILVKNLLKNYESKESGYGAFILKFFFINILLFCGIYGIKFLPSRDLLFLSLGISIVVISLFIEVVYEIITGKW